jgi:site-specific recombinase XerD
VKSFRVELEGQGYRPNTVADQVRFLAHVSRWLAGQGLQTSDLTPDRIEQFLAARRDAGYVVRRSARGMAPLLDHLRRVGTVPTPGEEVVSGAVAVLIGRYRRYLEQERGLTQGTIRHYMYVAELFLGPREALPDLGLDRLSGAQVVEFVVAECNQRRAAAATNIVCGLRSLLRYLYLCELTARPLAESVPAAASWPFTAVPKALAPAEVERLLKSCDRRRSFGRRDFAVLKLLVRLGLRVGEVASLRLSDIDWRHGEVLVRGKGPKFERLPLPTDVGEAIAGWLQRGRPTCSAAEVFTSLHAPHKELSPNGVSTIVLSAARRAGLRGVHAHRLRHTAATELLRAGAGLEEIGQLLRHQSMLTTSIYAKVDRAALGDLAKPWPSGEGSTK